MALILANGKQQYFDNSGNPLVGGRLFTMEPGPGITTPKNTWTDAGETALNANPIILDARGEAQVFWSGAYNVRLETAGGGLIYTVESIETGDFDLRTDLSSSAVGDGSALVSFTPSGVGAISTTAQAKLRERTSIFDFLTPAQITDVVARTFITSASAITSAFNAAAAYAMATSGRLYLPAGAYKLNTVTLTTVRGLIIEGAGSSLLDAGVTYTDTTLLSFDMSTAGTNGLVVDDFFGFTLRNVNISMRRIPASGGGAALQLTTGHDFELDNVKIDANVGGGGFAFKLGGGSGVTAAFMGTIKNCKAFGNTGICFGVDFATSLTFIACYAIGGPFQIMGAGYCSWISCGADTGPVGRFGYEVNGSSNLSFVSCGAEGQNRGAFYIYGGSYSINLLNPYGADNNQSGTLAIGDLVMLDSSIGAVYNVTVDNPTSVAPNAATVANVYANVNTGLTTVNGVTNASLSRGIGGDAAWQATKLTFTGDNERVTWTPILTGWTNVGAPTVSAYYVKKGSLIFFTLTITPGTSISATRPASTITGLPFGALQGISATMTDGNAVSYGAVTASLGSATLFPQTSGVLTVALTISGTLTI